MSTPEVKLELPHPTQLVTVRVPIVDDGDLNSELDATPIGDTVKKSWFVEDDKVKRFCAWFVFPFTKR